MSLIKGGGVVPPSFPPPDEHQDEDSSKLFSSSSSWLWYGTVRVRSVCFSSAHAESE